MTEIERLQARVRELESKDEYIIAQSRECHEDLEKALARIAKLEDACDLMKRVADKRGTTLGTARSILEDMFVNGDGANFYRAESLAVCKKLRELLSSTPVAAPSLLEQVRAHGERAVVEAQIEAVCDEPEMTFEQAWALKESEGYQYGEDALEQVRMGWEMHGGK